MMVYGLIKSYQDKWATRLLTDATLENREFGHNARSDTALFSFAGSSLESNKRYISG
jgi:hypothetical protein